MQVRRYTWEAIVMVNPCPGFAVTTPFGKPGSWTAGYHTGDDYAAPSGTPVVAAAAGDVVAEQWNDDYGNYVEIETAGIRHRYCHLSSSLVGNGQSVGAGQMIGYVGSTGNSTGPHLHYEERYSPYGYWDHRKPVFSAQGDPQSEEEDMFIIDSPGRAPALAGAGYFKELTDEERSVMIDLGVRLEEHNDRGYDVCRAACLYGEATD